MSKKTKNKENRLKRILKNRGLPPVGGARRRQHFMMECLLALIIFYFVMTHQPSNGNSRLKRARGSVYDDYYYYDYNYSDGNADRPIGKKRTSSPNSSSSSSSSEPEYNITLRSKQYSVELKGGVSTYFTISQDEDLPASANDIILCFLSSKTMPNDQLLRQSIITDGKFQENGFHPIFVDLPGYGLSKEAESPQSIAGARGYPMFVHGLLKQILRAFGGNRELFLVAFGDAGETIGPIITEAGLFQTKSSQPDANPQEKKQNQMFDRIKYMLLGNDLSEIDNYKPARLTKFQMKEQDNLFIYYYLKGNKKLSKVPDSTIIQSLNNLRYIGPAKLYRSKTKGLNIEEFLLKLYMWSKVISGDEEFPSDEFTKIPRLRVAT